MAKKIMVQGTMSGAGKSLLVTALCRIFLQDGLRVAPFKSQNMALNSFLTPDGLELGRAQAAQAEAAGLECDVRMNPILLKPTGDRTSQVILNGEVLGQFPAETYFKMKKQLLPEILKAYRSLAEENDVIVIEGAGSPAEINLREDDIVNMGLAEKINAPVLLVGDIDRGGVFAQLYGTVALLQPAERQRVAGLVINKFRGDRALLEPGLKQIEDLTHIPVLGVIPWSSADLDDEDSLAPSLLQREKKNAPLDLAVIRLPHISNFTDFPPLEEHPAVSLRYVDASHLLGKPDLILLPGTKNTLGDLRWLFDTGLAPAVCALASAGTPVFGICGGYQMLGRSITDAEGAEEGGSMAGLGLLPCETAFSSAKTRARKSALIEAGPFAGAHLEGYEIHMGETVRFGSAPFCRLSDGGEDGAQQGNVFGTYLHGLFDTGELTARLARWLGERRGMVIDEFVPETRAAYRSRQYDLLADTVRKNLDMEKIRRVMEEYEDV